ncbi:MAG: ABC transporter substrate-binding protein [Nocardioidaceae bacterium]
MDRPRLFPLAAVAATFALTLTACGSTEPSAQAERASAETGRVTVTDARGERVELEAPAQRVVALEWAEVEMLDTLGADVVGAADPKGYATWNQAAELGAVTEDVGYRAEPSVDAIMALDPDLVVLEKDGGGALVKQMEKAGVPVLVTEGSDASRNLDRMREDFTMLAQALGKEDKAEEVLADLDESFAETREAIADAGNDGASFALADGWMEGSNVNIRVFAEGALFSDVAEEVGLENAWPGKGDRKCGLATTDVEGVSPLKKHEDLTFLYSASDEPDVFAEGLSRNAIWTSMPFVEKDNLHKLEDGTWTFGGPASIEFFLDQLDEVFAR